MKGLKCQHWARETKNDRRERAVKEALRVFLGVKDGRDTAGEFRSRAGE
jgi:hypothetical protein